MIRNRRRKTWRAMYSLLLLCAVTFFCNCNDEMKPYESLGGIPPDFDKPIEIASYFPDSGGIGTQLIIRGNNFGTDTSYIRVTVGRNDKKAHVIGSNGSVIYAIVPARADTGNVKVHIGKGSNVKELVFNDKFKYIFKQNVTTVAGTKEGTTDGTIADATLRSPQWIAFDNDGAMYIVEKGEGTNGEGGIRKIYNGMISTLIRSNSGPFRRPRAICFAYGTDPACDTMYVANDQNYDNCMAVGIMLRKNGFLNVKSVVQNKQNNHVTVNPVTNELFYNRFTHGTFFRVDKKTYEQTELFDLEGDNIEFSTIFSRDGKTIYVIVRNQHYILKGDYNLSTRKIENLSPFVGKKGTSAYANGIGEETRFNQPCQGAVDDEGNLFVVEQQNHCVRKITPDGVVTLWAGTPVVQTGDKWGYLDGEPLKAKFRDPEGLAFGPDGALYVADMNNHRIRKILVE